MVSVLAAAALVRASVVVFVRSAASAVVVFWLALRLVVVGDMHVAPCWCAAVLSCSISLCAVSVLVLLVLSCVVQCVVVRIQQAVVFAVAV
eukprot:4331661-Prorocentrum_lima.AAC.1